MSAVFVDTSALLALLVPSDVSHERAREIFSRLQAREAALMTSSYVLVEIYALVGRRLGVEALRAFREQLAPLLQVVWVGAELHEKGLDLLLQRARRRLSLVDAVSFVLVRERQIDEVFAFDEDFERNGLPCL
jgi:uncharacterized protein